MKEVSQAPGIVGWSLGSNLHRLEFMTLSAWEDDASLHAFAASGRHGEALKRFEGDMRQNSVFVHFKVLGKDLPLGWDDALARQAQRSQ